MRTTGAASVEFLYGSMNFSRCQHRTKSPGTATLPAVTDPNHLAQWHRQQTKGSSYWIIHLPQRIFIYRQILWFRILILLNKFIFLSWKPDTVNAMHSIWKNCQLNLKDTSFVVNQRQVNATSIKTYVQWPKFCAQFQWSKSIAI